MNQFFLKPQIHLSRLICIVALYTVLLYSVKFYKMLFYCINILFIYLFMNLSKFTNLNHG